MYETLAEGSPLHMVPAIRTILGGFLFHGDDVYKKVGVLSGGERTRLAVARMLLRPSNTLLLDEPTNHLDMDSKDVLLDALEDFGGTLIFVSHDRYFIDKLATKIVDVGGGGLIVYPGGYEEYRWSREHQDAARGIDRRALATPAARDQRRRRLHRPRRGRTPARRSPRGPSPPARQADGPAGGQDGDLRQRPGGRQPPSREQKKQFEAEQRRHRRAVDALRARVTELEGRIAERETAIKALEATMSAPGFYSDHGTSKPVLDQHQALMWDVGDLMNQWEMLQQEIEALDHQRADAPGRQLSSSPPAARRGPARGPGERSPCSPATVFALSSDQPSPRTRPPPPSPITELSVAVDCVTGTAGRPRRFVARRPVRVARPLRSSAVRALPSHNENGRTQDASARGTCT